MNSWIQLYPDQASEFAWQVDALYFYLILVSIFFTVVIVAAIGYFFVRYGEKEKFATPHSSHGSMLLEVTWSIIPFIISMTIFVGGAVVFYNQYRPPTDAMEMYVVGKQWMWKIQHPTGQREINEMHIPLGRNIKLTMTTEDVLHDFFIPAFRTKADVVPGRYSTIWFKPTKVGKYHLFCAEYCGLNHSGMGGWVYVMKPDEYDNWLSGNVSNQTPAEAGKDLFENKLGCSSCHQANDMGRGPKLVGAFPNPVKWSNGGQGVVDEAYVRESILNPQAKIVVKENGEAYPPIMPTFQGQVSEDQLLQLIAYIKSIGNPTAAGAKANAGNSTGKVDANKPAVANTSAASTNSTSMQKGGK